MERKGEQTELGNINRDVRAANDDRAKLEAEAAEISAQIIDLAEERAKRAAEKEVFAAAKTLDPARVLDAITERRATFTRADLNFAVSKQITDAQERSAFMNEVLGHGETVALADEEGGAISRYTTRGVLKAEADVIDAGRNLAADHSHGIRSDRLAACIDGHHELDQEQRAAVAHATHAEGLAIIAGEAGTGKSRTMAAIREAYEAEGKHVIGTAWTNAVVQDMAASGFDHTTTIKGELMRLEGGYTAWNRNTVVMVDEAGMLATKHLAELMGRAEEAGAKLILVGDDKQLASIEHGGMFGALKEEHGAAELHTVRRVAQADQKAAFNAMHRGDFRAALDVFKDRGAIHWTEGENATQAALVDSYAQASAQEPSKTRFAFAYTNAEVDALNSAIRQKREERGELGEDWVFSTKHGDQVFAEGDRVQFTGNAADRDRKAAGLVNGMVGTVEAIKDAEMTVRLDAKKADGSDRVVTFRVGTNEAAGEFGAIRHGYAGTIYKGQGKTLDETFVLHSRHWRSASSYVALTRHREDVTLFVDKAESRDLDRLAVQMSRIEEKRAASGFHQVETPEAERPLFAGRYAALHDAHATGEAEQQSTTANQNDAARKAQEGAARAAEQIPTPENAEAQAAARQAARAQWIAARTEKIMDGRKQGLRLQRYHRDDRLADPQPTRPEESGGAAEIPRLPDHLDRYQQQLEERRADMDRAEAAYAAASGRLAENPSDMAVMFEVSRRSIAAERTREPGQSAERVLTTFAELRREEPAKAVAYLERAYQQEERAELARHRERGGMTR
jgi:Ti-type conjugative transfer relaxase TraA